ncbi:MAG: GGDEF domain-containing protein, partial [Chlorobia bacterium]|nr:GGDEF domain-containing protein [Fimbriimonadaceae bacterium]
LFNRRGLETAGRRVIQHATKTESLASVLMVDCDRLKGINDEFGHGAGDDALRFLADTLIASTRESDVVARVGGDEFVLVLADTDVAEANRVLERVEAAFDIEMEARGYNASLSIGSAQISPDARDLRTLVARADEAMYLRKVSKRSSSLAS